MLLKSVLSIVWWMTLVSSTGVDTIVRVGDVRTEVRSLVELVGWHKCDMHYEKRSRRLAVIFVGCIDDLI